jgi:hypothetical protein
VTISGAMYAALRSTSRRLERPESFSDMSAVAPGTEGG